KARDIYTTLVRRAQDPALLEYLDSRLLRLRIAAIPAKSHPSVMVSYTSVAVRDGDTIEYAYPLTAGSRAPDQFSLAATIKGQHAIQNVYSPTHTVALKRSSDREVAVSLDRSQALANKDFRLFYSLGDSDVGLTTLAHRPVKGENGHFLMLLTPR